jgi:hypothetical protein
MASSVTAPLERQFGQVPGLKPDDVDQLRRRLVITLQFQLDENIDVAEQEVQAAINAAQHLPADRPAQSAHLQQGEPGRRPDSDAGALLRHLPLPKRSKTWPTPTWRRNFAGHRRRAGPSAAGKSPRCAFRPTHRAGLLRPEPRRCARRWQRPTWTRPRATLDGPRQSYTIGATISCCPATIKPVDRRLPQRRAGARLRRRHDRRRRIENTQQARGWNASPRSS